MFRHVPNAITGSRLFLAVGFFVLLAYYQYDVRGGRLLDVAFGVYLVALVTDFLDGYLARRWRVEGAFGRIVDPFVDKILVLGSFIFFGGKNFVVQQVPAPGLPQVLVTVTGVAPWMVVLILGRELLVTSLRGIGEAAGANFGARFSGKAKMVLQSATILMILLYVNYLEHQSRVVEQAAHVVRDVFIWATILITLLSGLSYVRNAVALYGGGPERRGEGRGLGTRV